MSNATRRVDADLDMKGNTILNALVDGYYTKDQVDELLEGGLQIGFKPVDSLPAVGESKYIYLVPAGNKKRKNLKDEYIWLEEPDNEGNQWELIGSTEFKLDIVQNEDGIIINDEALQPATEYNDGLMTRGFIAELRGKQDILTAGPGIKIENNEISTIGGGAGGGHVTNIKPITSANKAEGGYYVVEHNLGSYDILFQIRTTVVPIEYVQARVVSPDKDTFWIYLSKDLEEGETLSISMLACDVSAPSPEPEEPLDIGVKPISGTTTWIHENNTGSPVFCQLYDVNGNEINGEIVQNSAYEFDPVIATTDASNDSGYMVVAKADIKEMFENTTSHSIDVTDYGFTADDKFLVMVFVDGMGQNIIQAAQTGSVMTIEFGENSPSTGYVILRKATATFPFENLAGEAVIAEHNLGRYVGAQLFIDGDLQITDVDCIDLNTCKAEPVTGTGYLAII